MSKRIPFDHPKFDKYEFKDIPLNQDLVMMDEKWMLEYEESFIRFFEGHEFKNVGYVSQVAARAVIEKSVELSWYADYFHRFHEIKIVLPRIEFVACVGCWQCDEKPHLFVRSDWLKQLHLRTYTVFALVDVIGVKDVLSSGGFQEQTLIELRSRIDGVAKAYPSFGFVSFADSLIVKANWHIGMFDSEVRYTYEPEKLFALLEEVRKAFQDVLGLGIYAILAQGSNEYPDENPLHISTTSNHVSLNSLGLPFAQLLAIENAARSAIRKKIHPPSDLYMDKDFFHSLKLSDQLKRAELARFNYQAPMSTVPGEYYVGVLDEMRTAVLPAK